MSCTTLARRSGFDIILTPPLPCKYGSKWSYFIDANIDDDNDGGGDVLNYVDDDVVNTFYITIFYSLSFFSSFLTLA